MAPMNPIRAKLNGHATLTNAENRKRNSSLLRLFFVALFVLVVVLMGLALHLSAELQDAKNTRSAKSGGSEKRGGALVGDGYESGGKRAPKPKRRTIEVDNVAKSSENTAKNANGGNSETPTNGLPVGEAAIGTKGKDRIYCMIPFIWNPEFYYTIMNTWGKRCDAIYFFTDSIVGDVKLEGDKIIEKQGNNDKEKGDNGLPPGYKHYTEYPPGHFPSNVIFLEMTRPWNNCTTEEWELKKGKPMAPKICRHIWEKMWQSWVYVGDHHIDKAEYFCKIDYDTYFFPENLRYYVEEYMGWKPYEEHHYFGHYLNHRGGRPAMIAGACACWSHKTMEGIAEVYRQMPKGYAGAERGICEDRMGATEEVSTSLCLDKKLGVKAEPARHLEKDKSKLMYGDAGGEGIWQEFVMLDPIHNHLTWNRTEQGEWWFWKNKPSNEGQLDDCCAERPIAIHKYKKKHQIEEMDALFYGEKGNDHLKKLNKRNKRYIDKVRKGLGIDK